MRKPQIFLYKLHIYIFRIIYHDYEVIWDIFTHRHYALSLSPFSRHLKAQALIEPSLGLHHHIVRVCSVHFIPARAVSMLGWNSGPFYLNAVTSHRETARDMRSG